MSAVYGYRIDNRQIPYFQKELEQGRLRQGWGYDAGQDLRKKTSSSKLPVDEGASGNLIMLDVKKGDLLLIPRLPNLSFVTIAEATEDWDTGYKFNIDPQMKDYGHIFPAKIITNFQRGAKAVEGDIRSTLRNPRRFWKCGVEFSHVMKIINAKREDAVGYVDSLQRMNDGIDEIFQKTFNEEKFSQEVYERCRNQIRASEWEHLLVHILKRLFPAYEVVPVGGVNEFYHGADILIYLPGLMSARDYVIAVQVKDYQGTTDDAAIKQICKADCYDFEGAKLIDKYVIYTGIPKNDALVEQGKTNNVKILFDEDLKNILGRAGKKILGENLSKDSGLI